MDRLDPKNDIVFKLMLTREPELLRDMVQSILARPVDMLTVLNPGIPGELSSDKYVFLDIRAALHGGSRVDIEMQMRAPPALASRLVYYSARDYADQLRRGDEYHLLTPTIAIAWLVEPLFPAIDQLHSIFELRERHTHALFGDQLALHILQLRSLSPSNATGYTAQVERWARFLVANTDAEFDQLASEDPSMTIAKQTLDELSLDPATRRLAREREDSIWLYKMHLAASKAEGEAKGEAKGKTELLLKLLRLRFGRLPEVTRARLEAATPEQLDAWAERILTANSLDDVLAP